MAGRFITLEGIEGSGKSVQAALLQAELQKRKIPALLSREPGGTELGRELRRILLRAQGDSPHPLAELLLYLADRCQHLHQVVEPALREGLHVVCDRYHDSTLAYQGYARGLGLERVDRLGKVLEIRPPDITLLFDLEVELGLERARRRNRTGEQEQYGRFEAEDLEFHRRVREGYHLLARREPERIIVVDASPPPGEVFQAVWGELEKREIW